MKKNLEILDFEDKRTVKKVPFTRFKTNEGWMSCFDKIACEALKKFEGKVACVEVAQSGDFQNIKKCYGEEEPKEAWVEPDEKPEVVRPGFEPGSKPKNGQAAMYASYAKDVFCVLKTKSEQPDGDLMKEAINLVKQAKEAFE